VKINKNKPAALEGQPKEIRTVTYEKVQIRNLRNLVLLNLTG